MIKKKYVYYIFLSLIIIVIALTFLQIIREELEKRQCDNIYANKIINLPNKDRSSNGFTGTGLFFDKAENNFYVGNAGKKLPSDEKFQASIEILSNDFTSIENSISCYLQFENMKDIQGITKSSDGTIWICSYGENKIRHIDKHGNDIGSFEVEEPSGIVNDSRDNTLWVLTNKNLQKYTYNGELLKSIKICIKGQDQLFLDEKKDLMYLSAGANYYDDSFIYTVDLKTNQISLLYVLKDSYAIEGIAIVNNILFVLNDGYYHNAKVPINQVNLYYLDDIKKVNSRI